MDIPNTLLNQFFVKVTKKEKDNLLSLCGESFLSDQMTCYIPAHQVDYIKAIMPHYKISDQVITKAEKEEIYLKDKEKPKAKEEVKGPVITNEILEQAVKNIKEEPQKRGRPIASKHARIDALMENPA